MPQRRQMHLGLSIANIGYHHAAWRHPDVPADGAMRFEHYRRCARLAEEGRFDLIFLADTASVRALDKPAFAREREHEQVKHEPLALMAALAAITTRVGLVPTVSSTYAEPYNVARSVGALDHLSHGRAGWNLVTGFCPDEARNYGWDGVPPPDTRYARAPEFLDVVQALFDGWDDDAVPRDKASGVFFDRTKMHMLDHRGRFFKIRGPLDLPPLPQRRPPVFTAGTSEESQELAAKFADVVYAGKVTLDDARSYYASVKGRLARYGRTPEELLILPGIMTYVGRTRQEAQDKFDQLQELLTPEHGLGLLATYGLPDYSGHDLDAPVPDLPAGVEVFGQYASVALAKARREGLSIRQLYQMIGGGFWSLRAIGTAADIADLMEEWVTTGAADGFNLQPPCVPISAEDFVALVIPELQRRGLFRREYEGCTLREHLGLPPAISRHARASGLPDELAAMPGTANVARRHG
ncbi:MAG: NtaA/DmoA family FMN-dependent monooxygenase [Acetobacteraceae bacterium]|nr:NtaA/DmoA family FMN-dependent monooxygenase [Acetobacteraceae bacterium]